MDEEQGPPGIDTSVPHSARIWNHLLGGSDNFAADRAAADRVRAVFPGMVGITRHSRAFLGRVVRHLAEREGIRQFLDIGSGLPTADNTHEIAQRVAPDCRVVYADHDPLVLAHAHALLTSAPEGATAYLDADVRDPALILREAARTLDLDRPVGLLLMGILGLVDYDEGRAIVRGLRDALPAGSFLGLDDGAATDPAYVAAIEGFNATSGAAPYTPRSPEQIAGYFEGFEVLAPGVVSCSRWRPEGVRSGVPEEVAVFGGLGRKP